MNIPRKIREAAAKYPCLEETCTGGNCDYITRTIKPFLPEDVTITPVLSGAADPDCPDRLGEPCSVTLYTNENWSAGLAFKFKTVRRALKFMAEATSF